jgi:hypothetical protein
MVGGRQYNVPCQQLLTIQLLHSVSFRLKIRLFWAVVDILYRLRPQKLRPRRLLANHRCLRLPSTFYARTQRVGDFRKAYQVSAL